MKLRSSRCTRRSRRPSTSSESAVQSRETSRATVHNVARASLATVVTRQDLPLAKGAPLAVRRRCLATLQASLRLAARHRVHRGERPSIARGTGCRGDAQVLRLPRMQPVAVHEPRLQPHDEPQELLESVRRRQLHELRRLSARDPRRLAEPAAVVGVGQRLPLGRGRSRRHRHDAGRGFGGVVAGALPRRRIARTRRLRRARLRPRDRRLGGLLPVRRQGRLLGRRLRLACHPGSQPRLAARLHPLLGGTQQPSGAGRRAVRAALDLAAEFAASGGSYAELDDNGQVMVHRR